MQIHNLYAKAACVLTLVCANLTALAGLHEPGQEKTVRVTIKAPDGQPLVGVCVGLLGEAPREVKRTGLNGTAELSINVVLDDGGGRIPIAIVPSVSLEYSEEQLKDKNRYEDLIKQYSFHMLYYVDVIPSVDAYKKEIVAEEAMRIVGRFVRSDGRTWRGTVGSDRVGGDSRVYPVTGAFKLLGMPKGKAVTLLFDPSGQPEVVFIEVSATQTAGSSLDLGDLVYEPPSGMKPVYLTVVGREKLKLTGTHSWFSDNAVTCVRADGQKIYEFGLDDAGKAVCSGVNPEAKLPPGEYFVMPGSCVALGQAARMVSLARSGRLGEIVAAEVPKFVVPSEGQAKPMVIDGPAAESKMLAIP